ncbi:hypothetical protein MMC25_006811 [Agyrium rufum]|nr:hypothetical protein [Agyrium rufum]
MADPLSITASIFAVLQLTSVVTKYTQELRGASKESAKLLLELSSLRGILESLSDFASSDDAWIQSSKILIGGSDGSLARLNDDLEGLRSQLEPVVGLKKVKKSVTWPFKHEEIRKIFGRLERFKSLFMLAMETDHISLSREINNNVLDVKDKLADMQQQCNSSLRSDILKWLSPVDPSTNHIEACAKHETNTGGWLLDSDQYQSWLRQDGEVLWLHGIPGAGKSVMFSTLVEGVRVRCDKLANTGHAYFYFDFKEPAKQNVENLYRSLLTQFSAQQPSIPSAVMKIYDESRDSPGAMKLNDLSDALFTVLGDFDRAYILIDALDECDERPLLLRRLQELARNAGKHWSLLLTSRGEYDIETGLSGVVTHNFEIQTTDTQEDIRTLIRSRLRQDPQLKKRPSAVKKKIENALEEGACGMYVLHDPF